MSGFEALGMASSVLQVIMSAIEMTRIGKAVYEGATADDGQFSQHATSMKTAAATMMNYADTLELKDKEEIELKALATKCDQTTKKLKEELDKISRLNAKSSIGRSAIATIKYSWKRGTFEKLEAELKNQKSILEFQLLVRILKKTDVMQVLQKRQFDETSTSLQKLASDFVNGKQDLQNFVTQDIDQIRQQIAAESVSVKQHISEQGKENLRSTISEQQRQTLRSSTKYSGMNQRLSEISPPSTNTYQWVLQEDSGIPLGQYKPLLFEDAESNDASWPSFVEWAKSDGQIKWYWVSGSPGSGKSTFFKYLTENPTTMELLTSWRPGVRILRYFFWKPGSKMQNSIQGLWCTFAYQLLTFDDEVANRMLEDNPLFRTKTEHHDWSVTELKDLCLSAFAENHSSYCIFVDGLDEINDADGHDPLLKSLDAIQNTLGDRVKLCVSSRLEHRFRKRINLSFELKLHQLTYEDLSEYTRDCLREFIPEAENDNENHKSGYKYALHFVNRVCHTLVRKADGVFLWLFLALSDVVRGFRNGDSEKEIMSRVEHHPKGINNLYQDMWDRLNGDEDIYQATAATMFSYMITKSEVWMAVDMTPRCMLLEMALALGYESAFDIFIGDRIVSNGDLQKIHDRVSCDVSLRSAGLLKIVGQEVGYDIKALSSVWAQDPFYRRHIAAGWLELDAVTFVHRTAYDYLLTTDHGRKIANYTGRSDGAANLLAATSVLAHTRYMEKRESKGRWTSFPRKNPDRWLPYISRAMGDENLTTRALALELLETCSKMFHSSLEHSGEVRMRPPLASYLLQYPSLSAFALASTYRSDITRVILWHLGLISNMDTLNSPTQGLHAVNLQKAAEMGLRKEQRFRRPLKLGGFHQIHNNTTILEDLFRRLLQQVVERKDDHFLTSAYETVQCLEILHLSQSDMATNLPLSRRIHPSRNDTSIADDWQLYESHKYVSTSLHAFKWFDMSTQLLSPEGAKRGKSDYSDLDVIFQANLSWMISNIDDVLATRGQTWHKKFKDSPAWRTLVDLQKKSSISPSAKVLYVLGRTDDVSPYAPDFNGNIFAFKCDFESEENAILLRGIGLIEQGEGARVWAEIDTFLKDNARSDDMIPVEGYVWELLAGLTPWFCRSEELDASDESDGRQKVRRE